MKCLCQKPPRALSHHPCLLLVLHPQHHIIAVAHIPQRAQDVTHKTVILMQVNIAEDLASQIANRQTNRVITPDHFTKQQKRLVSRDSFAEQSPQYLMVNTIEKLAHVTAPQPPVTMGIHILLRPLCCALQPLARTTRPYIISKCLVIDRHQIFIQQPVHHSIAHCRDRNHPSLAVIHFKIGVRTVPVRPRHNIVRKPSELRLQIIFKRNNRPAGPLASSE